MLEYIYIYIINTGISNNNINFHEISYDSLQHINIINK